MLKNLLIVGLLLMAMRVAAVEITDTFDNDAVPKLAVAGKLEFDFHTKFMVARGSEGHALNWNGCGLFKGCFGDFGLDGPDENYPKYKADVDGSPAIIFDGNDRLRHVSADTTNSICDGTFSVEMWVRDMDGEGTLVAWGDISVKAADLPSAKGGGWRHIALIAKDGVAVYYVDGKEVKKGEVAKSTKGQVILGAQATYALAALRIHNEAMTPEQLAHNVDGGVLLGTVPLVFIDKDSPKDSHYGDPALPQFSSRFSKHFRVTWQHELDEKKAQLRGFKKQLEKAEERFDIYNQLGYHLPLVSANATFRGDGLKYKVPLGVNWKGQCWMGWSGKLGLGFAIQGPGSFSDHEFGHGTQGHQLGCYPGNYWEAHADWFQAQGEPGHGIPDLQQYRFYCGNGRHYYGAWLMMQHLAETPEYGPLFIAKMWQECRSKEDEESLWATARRIDPDPSTPMWDEWAKMAARTVTWDYKRRDVYEQMEKGTFYRYARTLLEPVPLKRGWYEPLRGLMPQQFGFNICPLKPLAGEVTVDFHGFVNPKRGSEWRMCLVAVNQNDKPRYSDVWASGKKTMKMRPDEKELYLIVAATPSKVMMLGTKTGNHTFKGHNFHYRVGLTGAEPRDVLVQPPPDVPGHRHSNGNGFVANTAKVAPSAYVGPDAQVLDKAQVLDNARIADFAVVRDSALVRDDAVVSGHGEISDSAVIEGYAKVRDFARVYGQAIARDSSRAIEHAEVGGKGVSGYAVIKGGARSAGEVSGTSILEGLYAKGNVVTQGAWSSWSWANGKNDVADRDIELNGLYVQYTFNEKHPYLAKDTHSATHGYLMGDPELVTGDRSALKLNGVDQYVDMPRDIADVRNITIDVSVKWAGGRKGQRLIEFASNKDNCMYLTPADVSGKLSLVMKKNGKAQVAQADGPLPSGQWCDIRVVLSADSAILYVNEQRVAKRDKITIDPEDLNCTVCLLGRGVEGDYFEGLVDALSLYSIPVVDETPPDPNPAAWLVEPFAPGDTKMVMYARKGSDPMPGIEYYFEETSGNPGGDDSGWQKDNMYADTGLTPGKRYGYRVKMRDTFGNVGKPSIEKKARWQGTWAFESTVSGNGPVTVVMEAEHYERKHDSETHRWKLIDTGAREGYGGEGAMIGTPDRAIAFASHLGDVPRMDYRFTVSKPGKYYVWLRGDGAFYRSDSVHVAIDGQNVQHHGTGCYEYLWTKVGAKVPFSLVSAGTHTLSIWLGEDGTVVDRIVIVDDAKYEPTTERSPQKKMIGKGPAESRVIKSGKSGTYAELIAKPKKMKAQWSSLAPVAISETHVIMEADTPSENMADVEYKFAETTGHRGATDGQWQHSPRYEDTGLKPDTDYAYRVTVRGAGGYETEESDVAKVTTKMPESFVQDDDGLCVMEAEQFVRKTDSATGHKWLLTKSKEGVDSGEGIMESTPLSGECLSSKMASKPRLDYSVRFTKTGKHWVWVRGYGLPLGFQTTLGNAYWLHDDLHLGFDYDPQAWTDRVELLWLGHRWVRTKEFTVDRPGVRVLNVWMGEDASYVDKIVITNDEGYTPSKELNSKSDPAGVGPAESRRE